MESLLLLLLLLFSHPVLSDSLPPHGLQHARSPSLSLTISWSLSKFMFIALVMLSSHLILCRPLLLLPPIPPSIRVFSNESTLCMRWPKYWSFSFSISPSNEHPGLISFGWTGWISLQSKGLSRVFSKTTVQKHQFFSAQLANFLLPMKKRLLSTFPPNSAFWPTLGPFCVALCGVACPSPLWNCNKLSFQCQLSPDLLASPYLNNNKTYLFTFYLLLSDWKKLQNFTTLWMLLSHVADRNEKWLNIHGGKYSNS